MALGAIANHLRLQFRPIASQVQPRSTDKTDKRLIRPGVAYRSNRTVLMMTAIAIRKPLTYIRNGYSF